MEGDRLKLSATAIRRDFNLDEKLTEPVDRYGDFLDRVKALRYAERFSKLAADGDIATTQHDTHAGGVNSSDAKKKDASVKKRTKRSRKCHLTRVFRTDHRILKD